MGNAVTLGLLALVVGVVWVVSRALLARAGRRTVLRFRARVDRYKFTRKRYIVAALLAEPAIADAVRAHVTATGEAEAETWRRVRRYLDEMIPFFNVLAYYRIGYTLSRVLLHLFYKISVQYERADPFRGLPRDSIVIYLMNHRSNADYVLVAYVLAGDVSISYAVGEWARAFPLEYLFKTFGSYFIRRRYREPLYHAVLERYVQLITRNGVTQGIFPEGGLSRDGRLRPAKIGLLDYALGVARDPALRTRMYLVPIGLNYDRVLEDRSLLRELSEQGGERRTPRLTQVAEVSRYVFWNLTRLAFRRWKRYGRAGVVIGAPYSVAGWYDELVRRGVDVFALTRSERLGQVQSLCDEAMRRVGALVPVTSVCLTCAALQTFDAEFVPEAALLERIGDVRDALLASGAFVLHAEHRSEDVLARAYRMLEMRRVVARTPEGFLVLPKGRPLISFYANSIEHLLGPFAEGVRRRDALPIGVAIEDL
jgi:glycerol-3-phosphate O-acyltransferase